MKAIVVAALLAQAGAAPQQDDARHPGHAGAPAATADARESDGDVPLYEGMGAHHMDIASTEPAAGRYFDQGLALTFGFNHAEAVRSFRAAAERDPSCAICLWGVAFALGPNINGGMDRESGLAAYEAIRDAARAAAGAGPLERGLIAALAQRYAADVPEDRASLDAAYAGEMEALAARFPGDANIAVLAADALMNMTPWDYWLDDETLRPGAARAEALLVETMASDPLHAGACHMFVHLMEERQPDRAIPCAEKLPVLMPGVGHIVHMPGHIYIRVGRYVDAMEANVHAVHADESVLADQSPDGAYALAYYPHNYHFMWFAANMAGAGERSIEAARKTAENVNLELMRTPGMEALQHYLVTPLYALVRFGRWKEILGEPAPPADLDYPMGVWHYARALAYLATDDVQTAEAELARVRELAANPALREQRIWDLNPTASLLTIAADVIAGEIAAERGAFDAAVAHLRSALAEESALTYDEPPTWHLPVRHNLGAVLLEAGRPADAERVYLEDLKVYRENGWALAGLRAALLAQGRRDEADAVDARYREAWRGADVDPKASRFGG
jgi:tetratricopeptide (TPR) repeat protein